MRLLPPLFAASLLCAAAAASAQPPQPNGVPPGADPETGARPGNQIGTGMSLPLSDKAGNILPGQEGPGQDNPGQEGGPIAGRLPVPPLDDNASVRDFLLAARGALAAGRTGEAQEALERAETRTLDRSVPLFQTDKPIRDPLTAQIHSALLALGQGDRMQAMQWLQQALATAAR